MFPVTSLYVLVFAFLFVLLSLNVINHRQKHKVPVGDGGQNDLSRAISVHSNFAQYVPMLLIILALCEASGMNKPLAFILGFLMFFSRASHAYGMLVYETQADDGNNRYRFRKTGMIGTFASLILGSIFLFLLNY